MVVLTIVLDDDGRSTELLLGSIVCRRVSVKEAIDVG